MKKEQTSRRRFLKSAVLGAASTAAAGLTVAEPARARESDTERGRLERLVARYGSELGELRKVGR